jgi:hypothetical protein
VKESESEVLKIEESESEVLKIEESELEVLKIEESKSEVLKNDESESELLYTDSTALAAWLHVISLTNCEFLRNGGSAMLLSHKGVNRMFSFLHCSSDSDNIMCRILPKTIFCHCNFRENRYSEIYNLLKGVKNVCPTVYILILICINFYTASIQ